MIKDYYLLTKPGIIRGNLMTAAAGFLLASKTNVDIWLLIATLSGTALIIACGCVLNNYIDRNIDKKMKRTKKRAIARGTISATSAFVYASMLGALGFTILGIYTNILTTAIGFVGLFFYVVVYSIWKRRSQFGTLVGSISGAVPPVAGYCAVTNHIDAAALILFGILATWQMPHFYAIAMFRRDDYEAASIPVLPVVHGMQKTKVQIIIYIILFNIAAAALFVFGYASYTYIALAATMGIAWLWLGIKGVHADDDIRWAKKMFGMSLLVLTVLSLVISLNSILP